MEHIKDTKEVFQVVNEAAEPGSNTKKKIQIQIQYKYKCMYYNINVLYSINVVR